MANRAFPLIFAERVSATAEFYERLGFSRHSQNPATGEPSYVGLRRGPTELAVVDRAWPADRYGATVGSRPRFEMFVFVEDLEAAIDKLRGEGIALLREPVTMPWGERIAYTADPDGNPVALACAAPAGPSAD